MGGRHGGGGAGIGALIDMVGGTKADNFLAPTCVRHKSLNVFLSFLGFPPPALSCGGLFACVVVFDLLVHNGCLQALKPPRRMLKNVLNFFFDLVAFGGKLSRCMAGVAAGMARGYDSMKGPPQFLVPDVAILGVERHGAEEAVQHSEEVIIV